MKKVKVIFSAMAIFALIGGALAFKAKDFTGATTLYTKGSSTTDCNVLLGAVFTTINSSQGTAVSASTISGTNNCITYYTSTKQF